MPLNFIVQPIIEGQENGTWRFVILRGDIEGEHEFVAIGEVFETKHEALVAASGVAKDCQALQLAYELNLDLQSGKYVARIMDHDTGALVAKSGKFEQPEEAREALQQLVNECQDTGNGGPTLAVVGGVD